MNSSLEQLRTSSIVSSASFKLKSWSPFFALSERASVTFLERVSLLMVGTGPSSRLKMTVFFSASRSTCFTFLLAASSGEGGSGLVAVEGAGEM